MHFYSFVSNWSVASGIEPHVINDVKLFGQTILVYCPSTKIKCIRMVNIHQYKQFGCQLVATDKTEFFLWNMRILYGTHLEKKTSPKEI